MPSPLFDTHCHLQDRKFGGEADDIVALAVAAGVEKMLVCGYDDESIDQALGLAERHQSVYAGAGVHPHDADTIDDALLTKIERAARHPRCIAIGEIGLDFYRDLSPRDVQHHALEAQLEIARRVGLPVSVHTRAAEDAALEPLQRHARALAQQRPDIAPGVMHCFAGSLHLAEAYVAAGYVISVPCTITYPNNDALRTVVAALPIESLVVETDAPYLPPQSHRGQRNEPAYISAAVQGVAEAKGVSFGEAAAATTANARRVFAKAAVLEESRR